MQKGCVQCTIPHHSKVNNTYLHILIMQTFHSLWIPVKWYSIQLLHVSLIYFEDSTQCWQRLHGCYWKYCDHWWHWLGFLSAWYNCWPKPCLQWLSLVPEWTWGAFNLGVLDPQSYVDKKHVTGKDIKSDDKYSKLQFQCTVRLVYLFSRRNVRITVATVFLLRFGWTLSPAFCWRQVNSPAAFYSTYLSAAFSIKHLCAFTPGGCDYPIRSLVWSLASRGFVMGRK